MSHKSFFNPVRAASAHSSGSSGSKGEGRFNDVEARDKGVPHGLFKREKMFNNQANVGWLLNNASDNG
jgi:hypothetical protein